MVNISRRTFLKGALAGSTALFLNACFPNLLTESQTDPEIFPNVEFVIRSYEDTLPLLTGNKTAVWRYSGEVIKGDPGSLATLEGSYLGPIFHVESGQTVRIHYQNQLSESSIIHWHGLHVPPEADGHPRLEIDGGETYTYTFKVMDRAGTYWYHPHPHGRTGKQVMAGMAGLFIVHDKEENAISLPAGPNDLPLVLQDRLIDRNNQFEYSSGGMMQQMSGFLGNQILVNGFLNYQMSVRSEAYRLRLLNGSNARIYKVAWDDGTPMTVMATDGGLLETPIVRPYVVLAPGQRLDIWVDFGGEQIGSLKKLVNLGHEAPGGSDTFDLVRFNLSERGNLSAPLPEKLSTHKTFSVGDAANRNQPRLFTLAMGRGMRFTINDRVFQMNRVAPDETVRLNDIEVWEFDNPVSGGMGMMGGMSVPHPMHIHGLQFRILSRDQSQVNRWLWNSMADGFIDDGWHDTVLVLPGERVRVLMKFEDYTGLYLYHCHNLEHEDMGMMRNYRISA
jgi:FtsP/CotA-like multicopper oxidase with cupredoxin domain